MLSKFLLHPARHHLRCACKRTRFTLAVVENGIRILHIASSRPVVVLELMQAFLVRTIGLLKPLLVFGSINDAVDAMGKVSLSLESLNLLHFLGEVVSEHG